MFLSVGHEKNVICSKLVNNPIKDQYGYIELMGKHYKKSGLIGDGYENAGLMEKHYKNIGLN